MAPSPAAGKQTGGPKTPTKLTRNPQSTPKKLGQPSASKGTPSTPKLSSAKKPEAAAAQTPKVDDAKDSAQSATEDVQQKAEDTAEETPTQAPETGDDEDEPQSKVTQAEDQAEEGIEQAPEPIADDDDDAVEGAADQAQETADGAEDAAEETDTTEKAGETVESADEGTTDEQAEEPSAAAEEATGDAKEAVDETADGAEEEAPEDLDEAQKVAGDGTDETGDAADEVEDGAEDEAAEAADGEVAEATDAEAVDEAGDEAGDAADVEAVDAEAPEADADGAEAEPAAEADDLADGTEDQVDGVEGETEDKVEEAADETEGQADEAAGEAPQVPEDLPLDLSILKGREVQEDGTVLDDEGNAIAKLAEGDAEDLAGYPIGDDGEILDEDGDLVGRVELLPEEIKKQLQEAKDQGTELPESAAEYLDQLDAYTEGVTDAEDVEEAEESGLQLPGLDIMNGLTCQIDGIIYDSEGNTIGRVTEGDPSELQNAVLNDEGEFIDEDGNIVGHAVIHEDAADLVAQGIYPAAGAADGAADVAEEDAEGAEGAVDEAGEPVDGVAVEDGEDAVEGAEGDAVEGAEEQADGIEDQLPGIEAIEGMELGSTGAVVDEGGNILASIQDEELKRKIEEGEIDPNTLKIDEEGNVIDEEGNVLETLELADGAAARLAGGPVLDTRILDGKKVNKKGKIIDEDGEEIGELRDGDLATCAGKKVNEKGEVLDKSGNVIGHVNVVRNEASEAATKALLEELGELQQEKSNLPDLSVLDGLKVNKKGFLLDEDGEQVGQLIDGDIAMCAGKKVNDKGDVLDKDGNVIGRVTTLRDDGTPELGEEDVEEAAEEAYEDGVEDGVEEGAEEGVEEGEGEGEEEPEIDPETGLPPLSILEGLKVNKAGKLIDANGAIVGELVEGDAKKLCKSGITADAEGQFWDSKGHVIGRAQTLPQDDPEEEALFAGLEGLHVVDDGFVEDENGNKVGYLTEGDPKRLIGREVDEDGDVIDKKGSVVGHAERWEEPEVEPEAEPDAIDYSSLQGKVVNKAGLVIGDDGVPVARLVEGKAKDLAGKQLDGEGQIWNDVGQVIGRVELIPPEEREAKPEGPFAGLEGLRVIEDGKVADEDGNVVGEIVEGNPKRLIGLAVDEDGDIVDKYGNVKGHADPIPDEEEVVIDNSILAGKVLNKQGYVVDENGTPFGRLVEGDAKELAGRQCDEEGLIHNDQGKPVGRCEVIPENERVARPEGPFAGLEGLRVVQDGWVEDENENRVGVLVEGNPKRLVGLAVDEDGDIIDKYGNVKGHAEPWEEEEAAEEEKPDLSALAGTRINKNGNAVDFSGQIIGRVVEGDVKSLIGKKVDGEGQIWDDAGTIVGRCELVFGEDTSPEGPFAGFEGLQINKDGTVSTPGGDIIGRVIEGDIQKLLGHSPDDDGEIVDKNGNVIGKAERWEPEEKERRASPMSGKRVNKEGEVRDDQGDLMGKLTMGDLSHCVGQEIDDAGNVVDVDGNKLGEVTLIENIIEEEYEGPTEEELAEAAKREEERQIAEKMAGICTQTLEKMQPICKQIDDHMEKADRTPKEELDEEELVNNVKPLIEEGGRVLQECNGSLRGLDPDGKIAAQAKGRAGTGEATPEEHRLAESLKELTTTVVTCIDNAKKKLNDMPHAKKKLNPLWGLMTQPLFQILAAVGLLLAGVLGLVGQLLNGLGLGGLVNGLMGGLGINKLLESFGLGGGSKKKKEGGNKLSSLPIVGGFLGGK